MEELLLAAVDLFNGRASAVTGAEEGEHSFATADQWSLTTVGLDVDQDALMSLAEVLAGMMRATALEHPERSAEALVDGMRQMFVIGALHEQERARREASA